MSALILVRFLMTCKLIVKIILYLWGDVKFYGTLGRFVNISKFQFWVSNKYRFKKTLGKVI